MSDVGWLLTRLADLRVILDILVVTLIIYWLLWVAQGTRATQLIRGIIILSALVLFLGWSLQLSTLNWLLSAMWPALVVALPLIFQPELRRAFEQLGHTGTWLRPFPVKTETNTEQTVDEIVRAAGQLAKLRHGALMVLERETGLQDLVSRGGVTLDAQLTRQLLINIFYPNSPLHDAAVIIHGDRIMAASVVLPLTDNISASSALGTRHRAAIGVSEVSDALAIVVSEETGQMAVAHNGRLIRNLDQDRLRRVLRTLLRLDQPDERGAEANGRFPWLSRLRNGSRPPVAAAGRRDVEVSKSS